MPEEKYYGNEGDDYGEGRGDDIIYFLQVPRSTET